MKNFWKVNHQQLLNESYCSYLNHPKHICIDYGSDIIDQDTYFNTLPIKFSNEINIIFNNMFKHKQAILNVQLNSLLSLIKQDEVNNYRGFYDFLQNLIKLKNLELQLKIGNENSFNPPIEFLELKEANYPTTKLDETLKEKIQTCKNFSETLKMFNNMLTDIIELGTISIDINEFNNSVELEISINHEVRHFLQFLVRLNAKFYGIFNWYSAQNFKSFDSKLNPNPKAYYLDENEFITNASTVIDRIKYIIKDNKRPEFSLQKEQLLAIKSILNLAGCSEILSDNYWINIFSNPIIKVQHIINFFKEILNDHKYNIENSKTKHDKFKKLLIWTFNDLNK